MSCGVKTKKSKVEDIDVVGINVVEISKKIGKKPKNKKKNGSHNSKKCVWSLDNNHWGNVQEIEFFGSQIKVFVCEAHIEWHMAILALFRSGMDIEKVLELTKDDCLHRAAKLLAPIVEL